MRITISLLITVMLLPSAYLAYSLYCEQQFLKNADLFIENEFASKGYSVIFRKSTFTPAKKTLELAFLTKRFSKKEIQSLDSVMGVNRYLAGTNLIIRQDTTDRFSILKGDILSQIKGTESQINSKDVQIAQLEKQLAENSFDNARILKESRILYPSLSALSISNQQLVNDRDSIIKVTAVLTKQTRT